MWEYCLVFICIVAGLKAFIIFYTNNPPVLCAYHLCYIISQGTLSYHCRSFFILYSSSQCIVGHRDRPAGYHLHWAHRWCDEFVSKSRLQDLCVRSLWCHLQAVGHPWWHVQAVLHRPRVWHQRRQCECWVFTYKYTGGRKNTKAYWMGGFRLITNKYHSRLLKMATVTICHLQET